MAGEQVKSASINALDSFDTAGTPITAVSAGKGAPGKVVEQSDYCATTTAGLASTASTYKLVRLPWSAKVKELKLTADAALDTSTGLVLDVGAYYTDSKVEGLIDPSLAGTAVNSGADFSSQNAGFKSSALGPVDCLNSFIASKRNKELWDALGLSSNPGGFCDIVAAVHTAATSGGVSVIQARVEYVE